MAKQTKLKLVVQPGQRARKPPVCPECGRRQRHSGHRGQKPVKAGGCHLEFGPTHLSREDRAERNKAAAAELAAQAKRKAERAVRRETQQLSWAEMAAEAVADVKAKAEAEANALVQAEVDAMIVAEAAAPTA